MFVSIMGYYKMFPVLYSKSFTYIYIYTHSKYFVYSSMYLLIRYS